MDFLNCINMHKPCVINKLLFVPALKTPNCRIPDLSIPQLCFCFELFILAAIKVTCTCWPHDIRLPLCSLQLHEVQQNTSYILFFPYNQLQ